MDMPSACIDSTKYDGTVLIASINNHGREQIQSKILTMIGTIEILRHDLQGQTMSVSLSKDSQEDSAIHVQ